MRALTVRVLSLGLAVAASAALTAQAAPRSKKDAPYFSTPEVVVEAMLRLAGVGNEDVVYDLGCGDGRIVITAAKKHGARGVGVDIDPELIAQSNRNARLAAVQERVRFVQEDLFKLEIRDAGVVTLYLLPELNVKLRPRLLKELKPGSRVVSHDFMMGDWWPDRTVEVQGPGRVHRLHYWVVPAEVAGSWCADSGETLTLTQRFQEVSGSVKRLGTESALSGVRLEGNRLTFSAGGEGRSAVRFEGRVMGNELRGKLFSGGEAAVGREWVARRE